MPVEGTSLSVINEGNEASEALNIMYFVADD